MYRSRSILAALVAVLVLSTGGCSVGSTANDGTYRERLGTAARQDIIRETERTLVSRYNYRFDRRVTGSEDIRFITQWNVHTALDDERAQGVSQSRTRIFVSARPKNRSGSGVRTYTVIFEAEYEVQKDGNIQWVSAPMTPARTEYIEDIAGYLEDQVASGLRTY